jgi:hypothetical protein
LVEEGRCKRFREVSEWPCGGLLTGGYFLGS